MAGQNPRWLDALAPMFAIGAKLGGSPQVGTGALKGAEHANLMAEEQRQQGAQEGFRQQQIDLQSQAMVAEEQQRAAAQAEAVEQRRQQAIRSSVDDLRAQKFPSRKEYEAAVAAHEHMIGQFFGQQLRPNTLRTLVPFDGPNIESRAYASVEKISKQPNWQDIVTSNGVIQFDRDEDGIAENVPVGELIHLAKFPIARDPQTGQPMLPPKEVKAENIQEFDIAYKGVLAEWQAEGKDTASEVVKGKAATEARKRVSAASKQGNASVVVNMPERPMTRGQRFDSELRLRTEATKVLDPIRDMNRQVTVMRAGLDQIDKTGRMDAGTQAIVNTFNRTLEPGSVTREAEYLRSTLGQPLYETLVGKWQAITAGGAGMTRQSLSLMVDLAEEIAGALSDNAAEPLRMIQETATEFKIPVERVVPAEASYRLKPRKGGGGAGAPPQTPAGSPAIGAIVTLKDGKRVKVDGYNQDGSIKGTVVR